MSQNIPPLKGSPYLAPSAIGKKASKGAVKEPKTESGLGIVDLVQLSSTGKGPEKIPEMDMQRYLAKLHAMPEPEIDEEKVNRAQDALSNGTYGQQALDETVEGLMRDLGL